MNHFCIKRLSIFCKMINSMNNVLENTNPKYLKEVSIKTILLVQLLVIDDQSTPPVVYNGTDPRVRIYRSDGN